MLYIKLKDESQLEEVAQFINENTKNGNFKFDEEGNLVGDYEMDLTDEDTKEEDVLKYCMEVKNCVDIKTPDNSEEAHEYVERFINKCMDMYNNQPVTDNMMNFFNQVLDTFNKLDWESTDESVDDEINEMLECFCEFTNNLNEAHDSYNTLKTYMEV